MRTPSGRTISSVTSFAICCPDLTSTGPRSANGTAPNPARRPRPRPPASARRHRASSPPAARRSHSSSKNARRAARRRWIPSTARVSPTAAAAPARDRKPASPNTRRQRPVGRRQRASRAQTLRARPTVMQRVASGPRRSPGADHARFARANPRQRFAIIAHCAGGAPGGARVPMPFARGPALPSRAPARCPRPT